MSGNLRDGQSPEPKLGSNNSDLSQCRIGDESNSSEGMEMASREETRVRFLVDRLMFCYNAGQVRRWHARTHVIREETIAAHTWNVVMIILLLHPNPGKQLILAAMVHDVPEYVTGDIPRWFKDYPGVREIIDAAEGGILSTHELWNENDLDEQDMRWLKAADLFDAWIFLRQNLLAGNQLVRKSYHKATMKMREITLPSEVREVFQVLMQEDTYD
jgi:5'-deoxynucleotidase YfbR-like HD superfamily hydrolase